MLTTAALSYYPEDDPRGQEDAVWFFIYAEWWFGQEEVINGNIENL